MEIWPFQSSKSVKIPTRKEFKDIMYNAFFICPEYTVLKYLKFTWGIENKAGPTSKISLSPFASLCETGWENPLISWKDDRRKWNKTKLH